MTEFESRIARAWPTERWRDVTVVLAVSGGPDSVALARATAALRPPDGARLVLAHYNHGLRGEESAADEQFVVQLARQLDCPCRVGRADVLRAAGESEESLRAARYAYLLETAQELGARYVAVAHTADDQAETVLHHIVRGTGLAGLGGMGSARELTAGIALVRPLLAISRQDVLAYLAGLGQPFRVDRSNQDCSYTRNRLRNELLPHLAATYNPRISEALVRLANLAAEAQAILAPQVSELSARATVATESSCLVLDASVLAAAPPFLTREALVQLWRVQGWPLQGMGYDEWGWLAALAEGEQDARLAKRAFPGGVVAERTGGRLILSRRDSCPLKPC